VIAHAMKYVAMAEAVAGELLPESSTETQLREVVTSLVSAESELVVAYREFRALLRTAAEAGNKRAARYLEETTWDLT
jgi:hypothetical protein